MGGSNRGEDNNEGQISSFHCSFGQSGAVSAHKRGEEEMEDEPQGREEERVFLLVFRGCRQRTTIVTGERCDEPPLKKD